MTRGLSFVLRPLHLVRRGVVAPHEVANDVLTNLGEIRAGDAETAIRIIDAVFSRCAEAGVELDRRWAAAELAGGLSPVERNRWLRYLGGVDGAGTTYPTLKEMVVGCAAGAPPPFTERFTGLADVPDTDVTGFVIAQSRLPSAVAHTPRAPGHRCHVPPVSRRPHLGGLLPRCSPRVRMGRPHDRAGERPRPLRQRPLALRGPARRWDGTRRLRDRLDRNQS